VAVRAYDGERNATAGLTTQLKGPVDAFDLGEPQPRFPYTWWFSEGPPVTIVYRYGATVVTIRLGDIEPQDIPTKGAAAARAVALRILRCSKATPAPP
jgi:hypothetical protein